MSFKALNKFLDIFIWEADGRFFFLGWVWGKVKGIGRKTDTVKVGKSLM